jgi:hypothetical protein
MKVTYIPYCTSVDALQSALLSSGQLVRELLLAFSLLADEAYSDLYPFLLQPSLTNASWASSPPSTERG